MDSYHNECDYRVDIPYPPVRVNKPNPDYACEMLSNMGGVVSEMSDISRYFYNSVITKPEYSAIAKCFHNVSIVEMHHLSIFAELALQLGADPKLWVGRSCKCWWSPSYNEYPHEIQDLICCSIKAEQDTICKYSRQAAAIRDENIVSILNRIILDEERHIQVFREMYLYI